MSQTTINFATDPSGAQLLDNLLSPFQTNILTSHSGTSRPSYAQAGTLWLDNTTTPWVLKMFNGSSDIILGYLDTTGLTFNPSGNPKIKDNFSASANPTSSDNSSLGYAVGSRWYYNGNIFMCVNATGSAVWVDTGLQLSDLGALAALSSVGTSQIDNSSVTYAKIQNVTATDKILGRVSSGAGVVEEITCTSAGRALLDDVNAAAQRVTLGISKGTTNGSIPEIGVGNAQICASYSIPNNGVQTITMPSADTHLMLFIYSSGSQGGIFMARMGQTPFVSGTTNFAGTTGVLTGTTGASGKMTISTSGSTLYIENRIGFTFIFTVASFHNAT